jgi:hypothetical protein
MQEQLSVIGLITMAFIISIPCGYLRENFRKYSFMWFLLIHIPIPFIVLLRIKAGLNWHFIPLTLGGSVAGQIVGGVLNRRRKRSGKEE